MRNQPQRAGGEMEELIDRYQNMVYGLSLIHISEPTRRTH